MKSLVTVLLCVLAAGCSTTTYTPYLGQQQSWKTAPGGFVHNSLKLPIYTDLPDRPYQILGAIVARNDKRAVACALEHRADALILLGSRSVYAGTYHSSSTYSSHVGPGGFATTGGFSAPIYHDVRTYAAIHFDNAAQPPWETNTP